MFFDVLPENLRDVFAEVDAEVSTIPPDFSRSSSAIFSMSSSAPAARLPWPIRITALVPAGPFS
jgi:hypothetical protein